MRLTIDTDNHTVVQEANGQEQIFGMYTKEAFELISAQWLEVGWSQKYSYTFSWMGRPIIQLPEDILRTQEVIYRLRPDVIVETGIAHGGSLVFYASLCKINGKGRVIGIDIEIRPQNRAAIEEHELHEYITLIEGSSIDPQTIAAVKSLMKEGDTAVVILDSCHSKEHVFEELKAYSPLVGPGSYIIATDGIMEQVAGAPRSESDWSWNNPKAAATAFVASQPEFVIEEPGFVFNESNLNERVTYWPSAFIKRLKT